MILTISRHPKSLKNSTQPEYVQWVSTFIYFQILIPGVLTKADTVQEGDHQYWFDILENKSHYLLLGYFAIVLPGPSARPTDCSPKNIRDAAKRVFGKKLWSQLDKSRLGLDKLMEDLSLRLSKMISGR
jgi:hypothetical protein